MIDLTSSVRSRIKFLQDEIKNLPGVEEVQGTLENSSPTSMVSLNSRPNEIIRNYILTGDDGLIPRKNLKYDYSLISKCAVRAVKDQSEVGLNILYSPLSRSGLGNLDEVKIYSPASQKLTVGSMVKAYVINATANANHAKIVFHFLKLKYVM